MDRPIAPDFRKKQIVRRTFLSGLLIGVALVVQFPLLDLIGFLSGKVYFYSILLSMALIYFLTVLCGLYPSWLATKVQPAEALHYE